VIDSWRLKLYRAEEHLADLKEMIGIPIGRWACPVTEVLNASGKHEYALVLPTLVPQNVPILAGELLFNVRSALDQLTCALIAGDDKGKAQFPVFTEDPDEIDQMTGGHAHPNARSLWGSYTKGVAGPAKAEMRRMQPFEQARTAHMAPRHHSLAVLYELQNADKHCQLVFDRPTLKRTVIKVDGEVVDCATPGLHDGTVIAVTETRVSVEAEGEVVVPFGVTGDLGYEYPITFDKILDFVVREVLPALEPHLPGGVDPGE